MPLIKRSYDTAKYASDFENLGNAALIGDGVIKGWHVTSKPQELISWINSNRDLRKDDYDDLGPGLYMSAVPHFWSGRDTGKWSFLDALDKNQLNRLCERLTEILTEQRKDRYITQSEFDFAKSEVENARSGKYSSPSTLVEFAGQPYNILFWKAEFLAPLGIEPGKKIGLVEITAQGKFAELNYAPRRNEIGGLIEAYDGAFTRSGFSSNPQTVVYHRNAVVGASEADAREFGMNPRRAR